MAIQKMCLVLAVLYGTCGLMGLAADPPAAVEPAPKAATLQSQFAAFVKQPTRKNYLRVLKLVTSHPKYDPYSTVLDDVEGLLDKQRFQEALKRLDAAMPGLLLSPQAHQHAARAANGLHDAERTKKERSLAAQCIRGILATGVGSEKRPYLVTRVSNEYDVLRHLRKVSRGQGLRMNEGKSYDVIQCADGSDVWFDISAVFKQLGK